MLLLSKYSQTFMCHCFSYQPPPIIVTTYPKHQNFLSQILMVGTSCKRPPLVGDCDSWKCPYLFPNSMKILTGLVHTTEYFP